MDKDIKRELTKIVIKKNDAGDIIINPDVVEIIKENNHCVISDNMAKKLLDESLELAKIKRDIKNGNKNTN